MVGLRLKLNISLTLNHEPQNLYGVERRLILVKGRGESMRHVLMKLLGYLVCYHDELRIEMSAQQHYKPDLLRLNERGDPLQWIDCGQTTLRKLDRISQRNHETMIDIIKATPGELKLYKAQADRRLCYPERVRYWSFEPGFVELLGERIHGTHELVATVGGEYRALYLLLDGESLNSPIISL